MLPVISTYYHDDWSNGRSIGRFAPLVRLKGVVHAVTTRSYGVFPVDADASAARYHALSEELSLDHAAWANQVHGTTVRYVEGPGATGPADALMTDRPGVGLLGRSADCPLVLVADRNAQAVAVAHASWRGTVRRVGAGLIEAMSERFSLDAGSLTACICPSAGPQAYEVGPDVYDAALAELGQDAKAFFLTDPRTGRRTFDLWAANTAQLIQAGLSPYNVYTARICTITHHHAYPSYRVEGKHAGRFVAMIGIAGQDQIGRE